MITLEGNSLVFRFPEVHAEAKCSVQFQRTLRIPDDNTNYPLPPGLGLFPLRHVDDFSQNLSGESLKRGGVIMPMHQAEAMWVDFGGVRSNGYPFAVKVATGKICAVTGDSWTTQLNQNPQDYVVLPEQPWLDGYNVGKGIIRQFLAMPLGKGYSAEEQITGEGEFGGIQISVCPMKAKFYEATQDENKCSVDYSRLVSVSAPSMGLSPGGQMRQKIYDDGYGLDAWDQRNVSRCFVTIANAESWISMTGEPPPNEPPTAQDYTNAGLPWFDYFAADEKAVAGARKLAVLVSVADMGKEAGETPLPDNESVDVQRVVTARNSNRVREHNEANFEAC